MVYYYKGSAILAPFKIQSNDPVFDMTTVSLKTHRSTQGVQRWELSFNIQPDMDNTVESFLGTFIQLADTDTMVMPQIPKVAEALTASGLGSLASSAAAGTTSVVLDTTTCSGALPAGSFIKFSNHDKVYVTLADADLDAGSTATVSVYPKLRRAMTTSHQMRFGSDVTITFYQSIDNATGITFMTGLLANPGTISLIEAV